MAVAVVVAGAGLVLGLADVVGCRVPLPRALLLRSLRDGLFRAWALLLLLVAPPPRLLLDPATSPRPPPPPLPLSFAELIVIGCLAACFSVNPLVRRSVAAVIADGALLLLLLLLLCRRLLSSCGCADDAGDGAGSKRATQSARLLSYVARPVQGEHTVCMCDICENIVGDGFDRGVCSRVVYVRRWIVYETMSWVR